MHCCLVQYIARNTNARSFAKLKFLLFIAILHAPRQAQDKKKWAQTVNYLAFQYFDFEQPDEGYSTNASLIPN